MPQRIDLRNDIAAITDSPLARFSDLQPWELTAAAAPIVANLLVALPADDYLIQGQIAIHRSATIEPGATLKGPLIVGARCFVASGAYLRGGNWLDRDCCIGPGAELKSSFIFAHTHLAHFNFVGDSVLGSGVNLEAGSIICNHRNERPGRELRVRLGSTLHLLPQSKFGALVGDGAQIGANSVLAPGTLLGPGAVIQRGALCDQELTEPH